MFGRILRFFLLLIGLYGGGCGLPQQSLENADESVEDPLNPTDPMLAFTVLADDSLLKQAIVSLATVKKGYISPQFRSDVNGQAVINIRRSVLQGLDSYDMLYVFVGSDEKTTVQTAAGPVGLQAGQLGLKSYLGTTASVMTKIPFNTDLCQDESLAGKCIVSHFSTAKAVLSERQMRFENILSGPVKPDDAYDGFNSSGSQRMRNYADYVETALDRTDQSLAGKFLFLATAIKAQVERGQTKFLAGAADYGINQPYLIFEEVVANYIYPVHPSFTTIFPLVHNSVRQDLENSRHQQGFRNAAQALALSQVSGQVVIASAQEPVLVSPPGEDDLSVQSDTRFKQLPFFRIRNRIMSSDGAGPIRIMPSLPPIGITTCFQEFL